ncbi:hypothetical protein N007_05580 [Alicyclobacillus acidoterrestris ATCC 49025]|nr:hypothetical protein N007_05580 [Alicyclobacillus acidoterrestris ATCC 49025]
MCVPATHTCYIYTLQLLPYHMYLYVSVPHISRETMVIFHLAECIVR